MTTPDGEAVVELEAQPGSEGVRGENGTVAEFLEAQGVGPFLDASHRYHAALDHLVAGLTAACGADEAAQAFEADDAPAAAEILDLDACLALLARRGVAIPESIDGRVGLHLAYLEELAASAAAT